MPLKILFLTYDLPYPLNSGGRIRSYNLIKNLSAHFEITLYSYYRTSDQLQAVSGFSSFCRESRFFQRKRPWQAGNFFHSMLTLRPYMASLYYSNQLENQLNLDLASNHFDFVHFESFYPALFLPLVKQKNVVAVMGNQNIEYRVYQRFADQQFWPLRPFIKAEALRMRLFEEYLWKKADLNLAISAHDAASIRRVTGRPPLIIANGVNTVDFKKHLGSRDGSQLLFIGSLSYKANDDAARFLLEEIFPLVKHRLPSARLTIVSWYKPSWLESHLKNGSVRLIQDKQKHPSSFMATADIFVAPMRIASGTNIKILEAMAGQLPVVTTTVGIEGLDIHHREAAVADKPAELAQVIVDLLSSAVKRRQIGISGYNLVKQKYEWKQIVKPLINYYQNH